MEPGLFCMHCWCLRLTLIKSTMAIRDCTATETRPTVYIMKVTVTTVPLCPWVSSPLVLGNAKNVNAATSRIYGLLSKTKKLSVESPWCCDKYNRFTCLAVEVRCVSQWKYLTVRVCDCLNNSIAWQWRVLLCYTSEPCLRYQHSMVTVFDKTDLVESCRLNRLERLIISETAGFCTHVKYISDWGKCHKTSVLPCWVIGQWFFWSFLVCTSTWQLITSSLIITSLICLSGMPEENKEICILEYLPGKDVNIQTWCNILVGWFGQVSVFILAIYIFQIVHRYVLIHA